MIGNKNGQLFCKILILSIFTLYIGSFLIINFMGFPKFCTCDMYEDTAYSMMAWDSKSIFPENWVFGNQYYTIATPVLCSLIYGITGNVNFSMALATAVMTALIILSMLFLIRPFTDTLSRLVGITAIVGCMTTANAAISLEGQLFYIMASYYSCYLITVLIVIGDYTHALFLDNKKGLTVSLILSVFLCFATGMQSLRMTAVLILPLILTEMIRILSLLKNKEKDKIYNSWAVTMRVLLYAISNLFGAIYIKILDVPHVTIFGSLAQREYSAMSAAQEVNMRILQKITGFYYAIHEKNGLLYFALACLFTGIVLLAGFISVHSYISERKKKERGKRPLFGTIIFLIFGICIVELLFVNLFIDMNFRTPYLFVWYPLTAISCVVLFKYLKPGFWKSAGIILLCFGCLGNWFVGYAPAVKKSLEPQDSNVYKVMSSFVVERGYAYIYGDLYAACPIAAYSNGQILAGSFNKNTLEILPYINPQGVYGKDDNSRAVYIFYGDQTMEAKKYAETIGAKLTLIAEFYDGYYKLYTSDKQLMHYV